MKSVFRSGTSSFDSFPHLLATHTHFSLFIRKEPSPKELPDSKADPCWHPRLLKNTAVAAAPIRSIWKMRWDAVREKKNVEAVLWPAALTFPSPNTSKTQHLYKQPVRGTEGVTQQLRAQLVHDAQPAALCEYANILMERNMTFDWHLMLILQVIWTSELPGVFSELCLLCIVNFRYPNHH